MDNPCPPITNTAKRSTMPTGTGARRRSRRTVDNSTASESSSDDFRSVKIEDETVQQEVEPPTKKTRIDTSQSPRTLRKKKTPTANDVVGGSKSDVGQARLSSCKIPSALASSSKQPVSPNENEEASHQGEDNDGEASGSAPDDDTPKSHRASSKTGSGRGPPESRTCPYCKKVISTKVGLKYHIDNFVCRKLQSDDPQDAADSKRKRGKAKKASLVGSPSKRFRGALEDRTCPQCNRVFTSQLGLAYHVKHKVCKQASGMKETGVGLDTLVPGSRFVTSWGVVEVVKDDRATPSGDLSPTIKKLAKNYQAIKTRIDAHNIKIADAIASQLRGRRSKINTLYKTKNVTRRSIFEAYFQGNPHIYRNLKSTLVSRPMPPDPYQPPELCPDRIVECILIPDQRQRFSSTDFDIPTEVKEEMVFSKSPSRLFLQRKLLKEPYVEDLPTYTCANCGRRFISLAGIRYHMSANVCVQKMISEGESRKERQVKIELAAKAIAADKSKIMDMVPNPTLRQGEGKGRKRAKPTAMYPEVLMSLGFKVVKEDMEFTDDIKLPPIFATDKERRDHSRGIHGIDSDNEDLSDLAVNEPGVFLEILKKQLKHHQLEYQRSAADQKHGSMYVGVFKSLGYQKPRKRTTARERRASQRKRRSTKPPPPPKPLPPIIDTRALAHEVDAGRYPSMKRYEDEKHCDICFICRDGGDLVCCNFCCNAEHLKCIRTRFTVKDPEPADDFMCHKCIQFVLQRRNRAERRRLQKQQRDEQRKKEEALEESRLNPGIKKGMEYPYLAERGQEVSELVELLKDAQTRLEQALATSKMNNIRRKVMGCFFTKKEE